MIHEAYGGIQLDQMIPGYCLGNDASYDQHKVGSIVTCVSNGHHSNDMYYYDPDLLIDGSHWVKGSEGNKTGGWIRIYRGGEDVR